MEEIHKTEQKIADLQQYLKGLHAALKQEEWAFVKIND